MFKISSMFKISAGTRCFVDASWKDGKTWIGIFIHTPQDHNAIVIKAISSRPGTPLLAEIKPLVFAMQVCHQLQIKTTNLSIRQYHGGAGSPEGWLHDWSRTLVLEACFVQNSWLLQNKDIKIRWVPREMNNVADSLATSARSPSQSKMAFHCSNISHL